MSRLRVLSLPALLAPLACGSLSAQPDVPAVITAPTAATRAELQRILTSAFNGIHVTLANDALTRDSVLIVEQQEPRDAQGRRIGGRSFETPQRFRLVLRDSHCVLVREADGQSWPLTTTECVAAARAE